MRAHVCVRACSPVGCDTVCDVLLLLLNADAVWLQLQQQQQQRAVFCSALVSFSSFCALISFSGRGDRAALQARRARAVLARLSGSASSL
ncbi:unnamed protein product [Toxocara canis]|uniref:Secreted protein n=1 Tax=Toxocara canis TaxID=6265 RepID=A0A183UQ95_TOXCA|nr:unnamed protein product [Toxocara canis]